MYTGKLVFSQVMEFAPWHTFPRLFAKYRGDINVRSLVKTQVWIALATYVLVAIVRKPTAPTALPSRCQRAACLGFRSLSRVREGWGRGRIRKP